MIGIHLRPVQEAVLGEVTPALYTSASNFVSFRINGKVAHGARPQLGINAIDLAVSIITTANALKEDSRTPYSIKATQIQSIGNEKNTIPDKVFLNFDVRAQNNQTADHLIDRLRHIAGKTAELYGGTITDERMSGVPAMEHDTGLVVR